MISIGLCISLIAGGHFIANDILTVGDFTAFLLALTAAYKPAKSITGLNNSVQHGLLAADVLFEYLDSEPDIKDAPNAIELKRRNVHRF